MYRVVYNHYNYVHHCGITAESGEWSGVCCVDFVCTCVAGCFSPRVVHKDVFLAVM